MSVISTLQLFRSHATFLWKDAQNSKGVQPAAEEHASNRKALILRPLGWWPNQMELSLPPNTCALCPFPSHSPTIHMLPLPFPLKWLYCFSKAFFFFLIHHLSPADRKQLYPFILLFIPSVFYFCISVNVHLDTQRRLNTDKCLELSQNTISRYECSFSSIFAWNIRYKIQPVTWALKIWDSRCIALPYL